MSTPSPIRLGIACGAAAGALWGLVFLTPELVRAFTPLQLATGRYLAYGLIAAALLAPRIRRILPLLGAREWWALTWLSLWGNTLYYVLLAQAVQSGGIAMTALVIGFLPVAVTIASRNDTRAAPLRQLLPSMLLGVTGICCVGWQSLAAGRGALTTAAPLPTAFLGFACAVGALVSWSIYAVMNSRWLAQRPNITARDWSLLTGLATGVQALLLLPPAFVGSTQVTLSSGAWLHFLGVVTSVAILASIVGNAFWNSASRLLPATMLGQMILFETFFALLYGFAWDQRSPTLWEALAIALITASVFSSVRAHQNRPSGQAAQANDTKKATP